jgi:ribonuclease R
VANRQYGPGGKSGGQSGKKTGSPSGVTDKELLQRIARSPQQRAGYKQLIRELGLGGGRERRLLLEQLTRLTVRGELAKPERDSWSLPRRDEIATNKKKMMTAGDNLVSGRLDLHRDGYGFVRLGEAGAARNVDGDVFIPPNEMNGAMHGDQVLVELAPPGRDGRRSGRIARVLTRRNQTMVGIFHSAGARRGNAQRSAVDFLAMRGSYVTPLDDRMSQPIVIENEDALPAMMTSSAHRVLGEEAQAQKSKYSGVGELDGLAVEVEIISFPTMSQPARGKVIEVLGPPDAFGVDVEIIIRKHHLPHVFPPDVLTEAHAAALQTVASLPPEEITGRKDFRGLPIVTIDGETAKDFDDAVMVRPLANGNHELQVHIADVAHYVQPGMALDLEARVRGTSVYFPDRSVPMLPPELSSGICSLRPHEDRLVLSCVMEIDSEGEVVRAEIGEGIISSAQRMTYTDVQAVLDGDAAAREKFAPLVEEFERMHSLALMLNKKRQRRGSIDFDLPEPVIQFDELGMMQGIVRSQRGWANRLIEEFMLAANECVASWIERQGVASLYRIHEIPDPAKIADFEDAAAAFGYSLGVGHVPVQRVLTRGDRRNAHGQGRNPRSHDVVGEISVTPQMYQKLAQKISGSPEERILSHLMLRSLKQAKYSERNEGHFALAAASYTHFTSPIRRYPDLIVHRIVKALLTRGASPVWDSVAAPLKRSVEADVIPESELAAIAQESSEAERRADDAERELIEWKKMIFMQDRVGEDFDAIILSVTKYGMFVELHDLFIEGLVPIATLPGDHFTWRENARQICGERTGRCYRIGQKVHVLLDRIDRMQRRLQFAILEDSLPLGAAGKAAPQKKFKKQKKKDAGAKPKKKFSKKKRR